MNIDEHIFAEVSPSNNNCSFGIINHSQGRFHQESTFSCVFCVTLETTSSGRRDECGTRQCRTGAKRATTIAGARGRENEMNFATSQMTPPRAAAAEYLPMTPEAGGRLCSSGAADTSR